MNLYYVPVLLLKYVSLNDRLKISCVSSQARARWSQSRYENDSTDICYHLKDKATRQFLKCCMDINNSFDLSLSNANEDHRNTGPYLKSMLDEIYQIIYNYTTTEDPNVGGSFCLVLPNKYVPASYKYVPDKYFYWERFTKTPKYSDRIMLVDSVDSLGPLEIKKLAQETRILVRRIIMTYLFPRNVIPQSLLGLFDISTIVVYNYFWDGGNRTMAVGFRVTNRDWSSVIEHIIAEKLKYKIRT